MTELDEQVLEQLAREKVRLREELERTRWQVRNGSAGRLAAALLRITAFGEDQEVPREFVLGIQQTVFNSRAREPDLDALAEAFEEAQW